MASHLGRVESAAAGAVFLLPRKLLPKASILVRRGDDRCSDCGNGSIKAFVS